MCIRDSLQNGRDDPPVRRKTPEDRQRVKDVSEHSGMSKEQHPCRVGQLDPTGANLLQDNGFQLRQGRRATIEMVLGAQFGQATQPGRQARWVVEVDEPLVCLLYTSRCVSATDPRPFGPPGPTTPQ